MRSSVFGDPRRWPQDDLVALSEAFDPDLCLEAYRNGLFPMPTMDMTGWYSPLRRAVLPLEGLRVTRSLRKMTKRYTVRVDSAFTEVLQRCADPRREDGWIDDGIRRVYGELHRRGHVHSVEAWSAENELVGGLYGVSLGGLFAGESMFHDPERGRDASKVALVALVDLLRADGVPRLLDVQWRTPHLASLGVVEIARSDYLRRVRDAVALPPPSWDRAGAVSPPGVGPVA